MDTYEVPSIHDAIFYRVSAVQGEFQDLLLLLATLDICFFLVHKQNSISHSRTLDGCCQTTNS